MKTWIWPLSWLSRIRELEQQNRWLMQKNKELTNELAAQSICNASMSAGYASALASMSEGYIARYRTELQAAVDQAEWDRKFAAVKAEHEPGDGQ